MFLKWLPLPILVFSFALANVVSGEENAANLAPAAQTKEAQNAALTLLPANAKVVALLDMRALNANKVLEPVLNKLLERDEVQVKLNQLQDAFGFDPRRDLNKIIFCNDPCEKGSKFILLEGSFDKARVEDIFLKLNADSNDHNGHAVYALPDDKEPNKINFLSFIKPDLVAIGTEDAVLTAIEKSDQPVGPLGPAAQLALELPEQAVLRIGANDLAQMPGVNDPIRSAVRSAALTFSLSDKLQAKFVAHCQDETAAKDISVLAEGAAGMGRLMLAKRPELSKMLSGLVSSVRFVQERSAVRGSAALLATDATGVLLWLMDLQAKKIAAADGAAAPDGF
jgi:hypothetical protein